LIGAVLSVATYQVKVGGEVVATSIPGESGFPPNAACEPIALERSYDGPAVLTLFVRGDSRRRTFQADATVQLLRDDAVIFTGLLDLPRVYDAAGRPGGCEYQAIDRSRLAAMRQATDAAGNLKWQSGYGNLTSVVNAFLGVVAGSLGPAGIEVSARFNSGAAGIECYPVSFEGETIDGGLRRIAAAAPGVRLFMGPGDSQYVFVAAWKSPELTINASAEMLAALDIRHSIDGCCGAVQTNSRQQQVDYSLAGYADLTPAWSPSLESQWSLANAAAVPTDGPEAELARVFRVFNIVTNPLLPPPTPQAEKWVEVRGPDDAIYPWIRKEISRIDLDAKLVESVDPLIGYVKKFKAQRRNPNIPGACTAAIARLRYTQSGSGTQTIQGERYPVSGYGGRAFQLAPVSMAFVKQIEVPALPQGSFNHALYARAAHDVLSEPVVAGQCELRGEPPAAIFGLDRRINFAATGSQVTGYETLRAPLMGFRMAFEAGFTTTLQFSTQRSVLLAGGQA